MATGETRVMGWVQLIGGLVALWAAMSQNWLMGIAALGFIFVASGYHHLTGHK